MSKPKLGSEDEQSRVWDLVWQFCNNELLEADWGEAKSIKMLKRLSLVLTDLFQIATELFEVVLFTTL